MSVADESPREIRPLVKSIGGTSESTIGRGCWARRTRAWSGHEERMQSRRTRAKLTMTGCCC